MVELVKLRDKEVKLFIQVHTASARRQGFDSRAFTFDHETYGLWLSEFGNRTVTVETDLTPRWYRDTCGHKNAQQFSFRGKGVFNLEGKMGRGDTQEYRRSWFLGALRLLADVYLFGWDTFLLSPVFPSVLRCLFETLNHPGGLELLWAAAGGLEMTALLLLPSRVNAMCFNNEWVINSNCFGELWCDEPYRTMEPSINDAGMHNRDVSICYKLHYKPDSLMPLIHTSLTCYYNTSLENGLGGKCNTY